MNISLHFFCIGGINIYICELLKNRCPASRVKSRNGIGVYGSTITDIEIPSALTFVSCSLHLTASFFTRLLTAALP